MQVQAQAQAQARAQAQAEAQAQNRLAQAQTQIKSNQLEAIESKWKQFTLIGEIYRILAQFISDVCLLFFLWTCTNIVREGLGA